MKDLLRELACALVTRPDEVSVAVRQDAGVQVLELEVAPEDRGHVIGRRGRTAEALRTLLAAVARRRGESWRLEVLD